MRERHQSKLAQSEARPRRGFTLIELLVTLAIIGVLAALIISAVTKGKGKGQQVYCLNNLRQLGLSWMLYAHDHDDRLPHNLGGTEIKQMLARGLQYNWANSLLNWELDSENTNELLNTQASLGPYLGATPSVFQCPRDYVLSSVQREAGWSRRSRSISMNAMVGDAGEFTKAGNNVNNPSYHQFLKLGEFKVTSQIFVFIEEHPHSINDGYFLNKGQDLRWHDLPASYHNGGANLSFADGHAERRIWKSQSTKVPARPDVVTLPMPIAAAEAEDFRWLRRHTSTYER